MANVVWVGKQQAQRQVDTLTVGSSTVGQTFTVTINGKVVSYTAVTGDTTTTIATNLQALLAASTEGEFSELTWGSVANSAFTATGPVDGAPFTLTTGGTGTLTRTATTAPKSPSDIGDGANYSTGSLPTNADTLVFENSAVDAKYNAAALTAITCGVIRRDSYTGRIGLPDTNPAGYREYRPQHLETAGTSYFVVAAPGDSAGQVRLRMTAAGAVTVTVTGSGASGQPGNEPVEFYGASSGFTVNLSNAGLAIAAETNRAATITTVRATDATLRVGPGATLTTANLTNTDALFQVGYTTLTVDRGGTAEVRGSGSGTTTTVDGGTLLWKSTGALGTPTVGSDGTIDLTDAPAAVAITNPLTVREGGTVTDPAGRLIAAGSFNVSLPGTELSKVSLDLGTGRAFSVTA